MSYAEIDGLRTWHEVTGDGPPVVLLHGAFGGADTWALQTPALVAAGYRVHAPERRGHAHTPDADGPITYQVMAEDTIAYLDQIVAGPAHLVGWSDGSVVGLLVAMQRPDLVVRLVLIGQYYNSSGKASNGFDQFMAQHQDQAMEILRGGYDLISPDGPEHFPLVFEKMLALISSEPDMDLGSLASVHSPTLVMQGDRDDVTIEHSAAVVRSISAARLAVLPGTHALPIEDPVTVNALLISFLRGGPSDLELPWTVPET